MFFHLATDGTRQSVPIENLYAGSEPTPCWIIGGGPSLKRIAVDQISASTAPTFAVNLAGTGLLRPTFWTSYDPSSRFHKSVYLDPGVTKFVHLSRAMDLVPETTLKVCDSPATFMIDRESQTGFHNFPGQGNSPITDWQDSLIQAIEVAYRLGFRELYLAGCEQMICPSRALIKLARKHQVIYQKGELLGSFVTRCEQSGLSRSIIENCSTNDQYHFDESKDFAAAIQTDGHYYRVVQSLRLARRSMSLAGLKIVSVTPGSRFNDFFPYRTVPQVCHEILCRHGNPQLEETRGRYTSGRSRVPENIAPMQDLRPHFWRSTASHKCRPEKPSIKSNGGSNEAVQRLRAAMQTVPETRVNIDEEGN
ncbi:hypothetical protein SH668x_000318 [Planctomicrobium sp. SH668]|uniref:hypothetical protein n=1 Tax=Planctomicrobium sp. SH668 TaxID=3448126 RepID=UPI003F5BE38B